MRKRKKRASQLKAPIKPATLDLTGIIDFLIEDYRFSRSYISAVDRLFPEEKKKFESSFVFHRDRMNEFAKRFNIFIKTFDNFEYNEGLPITPLNADDFESVDNLIC